MTAISLVATAGCMSPVVMHDAAIAYDQLFQLTVTDVCNVSTPTITIGK